MAEIGKIVQKEAESKGVNISGDAQHDSRGFSSRLGRYTAQDINTNFIIDYEVVDKVIEKGKATFKIQFNISTVVFKQYFKNICTVTVFFSTVNGTGNYWV